MTALTLALPLSLPPASAADRDDVERPVAVSSGMVVSSDQAEIDIVEGTRRHRGNVVVEHGNFRLEAEQLVEYRRGRVAVRVVATGNPARFRQHPPYVHDLSHGRARRIEYEAASRQVRLSAYSVTDTSGNVMKGKQATWRLGP